MQYHYNRTLDSVGVYETTTSPQGFAQSWEGGGNVSNLIQIIQAG
jgi:hypothetical protein